jgi:DNA topoisomerase-6 subunit B
MYAEEVVNSLSYVTKADIEELRSSITALIKARLKIEKFEDLINNNNKVENTNEDNKEETQ